MTKQRSLLVVAILIGVFGAATAQLFVFPRQDDLRPADAVVIFAGGRGERLRQAERLMDAGLADHLVVPNGLAPEWPAGRRACRERRSYEVYCPTPSPDTTRGEARTLARLARAEEWETLIVVTSTYQATRADLLLGRCFDGDVIRRPAAPGLRPVAWLRRIAHEWGGWLDAVVVARGC